MAIGRPIEQTPNIADKVVTATATAGQTEFTVTGGYRINHLAVFRNGVRLVNGNDFTALDGTTVTLLEDAANLDVLEFQVFDSFSVSDALLTNAASQTVNGDVTVVGTFTVGTGGIGTFVAAEVNVGIVSSNTGITTVKSVQAASSTTTGALQVKGGVGIGKSLYVGGNVSVGGTLTYEDVTNVDSVGLVTAGKGLRVTTGGLVVTAGVSTFAGITTVTNTAALHCKQLNVSAGSTFGGAITASDNLTFAGTLADSSGFSVTGGNVIIPSYIAHDGDSNTKFGFLGADGYSVTTGGTEAFRVDSSQRLLVGTTDGWGSDAKLHLGSTGNTYSVITSGTSHNGVLAFSDDGSERGSIDYDHNGDHMLFKTAGSERVRVSAAGSLAIGDATEPGAKLYVNGLSTNDIITARCADSNGASVINILSEGTTGYSRIKFSDTAGADGQIGYSHSARELTFATAGTTERMSLSSAGVLDINNSASASHYQITQASGNTVKFGIVSGSDIELSGSSNNSMYFKTNDTERLRITGSGKSFLHGGGATGANDTSTLLSNGNTLNIHGTSSVDGISVVRYSADYGCYGLNIAKSNNSTFGTNTLVTQGEELGHVSFYGADGTNFEMAAQITALVDINGAPTNGTDMPGALSFRTSPDGSATPGERIKIDCRGFVGINESNPDELLHLSANNTSASNSAYQSAGNTIRLTDTDTDVTSNQPGGTIEWETLDSSASGVNAYIATKNSNTGYSEMVFGTGNASTLDERLAIDQNGKILIGNTRSQYTNDYYDDITINNSGGSGATGGSGITMISDSGSWGAVQFGDDNDDDVGYIKYDHNTDVMRFAAAGEDQQILGSNVIDYFQHNAIMQKNGTVTIADGASKTFTITGLAYGWAKLILGFYGEGQYCGVQITVGGLMAGGGKYYDNNAQMNSSSGSCSVGLAENNASFVVTITNNVGNGGSLHGCSMFYGGSVNDGHPAMAVA